MDTLSEGWNVVCQDESIFVYDSVIRSVWAIKGSKPRVKITGSHKKTFIFGSLSLDGRQLFRQYSQMNAKIFVTIHPPITSSPSKTEKSIYNDPLTTLYSKLTKFSINQRGLLWNVKRLSQFMNLDQRQLLI